jgi:hypothetical protein
VYLWSAKRKGPIQPCTETTQQWRHAHEGTRQKNPNRKGHNIRFAHLFEQRVYQCDKQEREDKVVHINSIMSEEALQKSLHDEHMFLKENYGYSRLTAPMTTKKEQKAHWRTFQVAAYFQTDAERAEDLAEVTSAFPNSATHNVEPTQTMETAIVPYVHAQKWQLMCNTCIFVRAAEDNVLFVAEDVISVSEAVEDSVSVCLAVEESVDDVAAAADSVQVEAVTLRRSKRSQSAMATQKIRALVGPKAKKKTVPKATTTRAKSKCGSPSGSFLVE